MSLGEAADRLAAAPTVPQQRQPRPSHPKGWEPGVALDGDTGILVTNPMAERPRTWDDLLRMWGLDPAEFDVEEPVGLRAWDAQTSDGIQRMHYYRLKVRRRTKGVSADELVKAIARHKPRKRPEATGDGLAYVVCSGDLQLGKPDGDGTAGTVDRFLAGIDTTVARLRELRKAGRQIDAIYLPWLGDCIEGASSQGGRLIWRLELTVTEMVRVYRRLLLAQIQAFAPLAERVVVPVVPGNHDEALRVGDKMATRYDDSWAVEGAVAVADALAVNPEAYGHVSVVVPGKDELTLTLDICGTTVGLAHGHQFGRSVEKWWAGQAHGMQPIGDATLLLGAHLHHLRVEQQGRKTFIQTPALDGGSTWFRHRSGLDAPPAVVSLLVGQGGWSDLAVS